MIVKIVHFESLAASAGAKRIVLIDGVDSVEHEVVSCRYAEDLEMRAASFWGCDGRWYGPSLPSSSDESFKGHAGVYEAILLRLKREGRVEGVVAVNASVFFMNRWGKTIDKVVCRFIGSGIKRS